MDAAHTRDMNTTQRITKTAIAAVQRVLGCDRFDPQPCADEDCGWCGRGPFCQEHGSDALWTERGCAVAVSAADAALSTFTPRSPSERRLKRIKERLHGSPFVADLDGDQ